MLPSMGIGEPVPVAQTFTFVDEELGIDLTRFCRLDCMVTVVDAYRFWHDFSSGETLLERNQAAGEDDVRDLVDLLISQIEFCDVLILNKCDMVAADELAVLEAVLRKLQPRAKLIRAVHGRVDPADILNTGLFNYEEASRSRPAVLRVGSKNWKNRCIPRRRKNTAFRLSSTSGPGRFIRSV